MKFEFFISISLVKNPVVLLKDYFGAHLACKNLLKWVCWYRQAKIDLGRHTFCKKISINQALAWLKKLSEFIQSCILGMAKEIFLKFDM